MEERNNNVVTAVIITLMAVAIIGLVGFIVYDKVINKTNEPNSEENNKVDNNENKQEVEEQKTIEVTKSLEEELRKLIPSVKSCNNQYLDKQYNGSIFTSGDLKDVTYLEECQGVLDVETLSYKNESTKDEVYLYDYVLIYSQQKAEDGKGNYGTRYDDMNIKMDDIELIDVENYVEISEKSFKEYGQVYKYTFKLVNGNYEYVSTEAVK